MNTYKTWKAVQLPILGGILPVKLLFLTSLHVRRTKMFKRFNLTEIFNRLVVKRRRERQITKEDLQVP